MDYPIFLSLLYSVLCTFIYISVPLIYLCKLTSLTQSFAILPIKIFKDNMHCLVTRLTLLMRIRISRFCACVRNVCPISAPLSQQPKEKLVEQVYKEMKGDRDGKSAKTSAVVVNDHMYPCPYIIHRNMVKI